MYGIIFQSNRTVFQSEWIIFQKIPNVLMKTEQIQRDFQETNKLEPFKIHISGI